MFLSKKGNEDLGVIFLYPPLWIFVIFFKGWDGLRMCVMMCCALMCLNVFIQKCLYVDIKEKTNPNDLCISSSLKESD